MSTQDTATDSTISVDDELETLREGIDDPMVLKEQLRKEADARRQLTARAKNAEQEKKELLEKLATYESKEIINKDSPTVNTFEMNDEVVDLRLDGYSKDEVAWIMQNGGRKALEDTTSYTAIAINAKREQQRAEQAASQTADTAGLSEIERQYTPEQLANMSVKELENILPRSS